MEPRFIALLGRSYDLAAFELATILGRYNCTAAEFKLPYFYEIVGNIDPQQLVTEAGGIVKIYKLLDNQTDETPENIIAKDLIEAKDDHFCVSAAESHQDLKYLAQSVKKLLQAEGIKPHFRILDDAFYSAGVVNKYSEYLLLKNEGVTHVLLAVAVQNLNYWTKKDYGRPAFDPSSGMLPPKIARIMVNSAFPNTLNSDLTFYDPMCGSGTLLIEGMDLGVKVIGSDMSTKAVAASTENTKWFERNYRQNSNYKVFQSDATHVTLSDLGNHQVDAVVFEGYLGPPFPKEGDVPNLIKGLEKLYKGVFKNLSPLLKDNGLLVCALPEYSVRGGVKNLDTLVDWTSSLGYTRRERFTYGRTQAFVKRAIYVLQKKAQ